MPYPESGWKLGFSLLVLKLNCLTLCLAAYDCRPGPWMGYLPRKGQRGVPTPHSTEHVSIIADVDHRDEPGILAEFSSDFKCMTPTLWAKKMRNHTLVHMISLPRVDGIWKFFYWHTLYNIRVPKPRRQLHAVADVHCTPQTVNISRRFANIELLLS